MARRHSGLFSFISLSCFTRFYPVLSGRRGARLFFVFFSFAFCPALFLRFLSAPGFPAFPRFSLLSLHFPLFRTFLPRFFLCFFPVHLSALLSVLFPALLTRSRSFSLRGFLRFFCPLLRAFDRVFLRFLLRFSACSCPAHLFRCFPFCFALLRPSSVFFFKTGGGSSVFWPFSEEISSFIGGKMFFRLERLCIVSIPRRRFCG